MNIENVISALTLVINAKYPASKVANKEIKTADRPCFYIKFITEKDIQLAESYTQESISFDLLYFAESRYEGYLDLLDKRNELKALLKKPLKVGDKYLEIDEIEFNLNEDEYILDTLFNVNSAEYEEIESVDDNNQELMENLVIDKV